MNRLTAPMGALLLTLVLLPPIVCGSPLAMGPFRVSLLTPGHADGIHMLAGRDTPSAAAIEGAVQRGA
jgi:hypothetical protein